MANTKITSRVIADNAVTTAAIADDAITSAKLDTNIAVAGTLTVTGDANFDSGTLFVDASANYVGIGTSSPAYNFQLSNTAGDANLGITASTTGLSQLLFTDGSTAGKIAYRHPTNAMEFTVNSSEKMRVDSSGRLLVGGTTTPETNGISIETTAASGGLQIISPTTGRGDIFFGDTADLNIGQIRYAHSDNSMTFRTNASDRLVINSSGNVGIGTSSPASYTLAPNLVVDAGTDGGVTIKSGTSNYGGLFFADGTSGNQQYRGFVQYNHNYVGTTDSLLFGTAGAERMRINSYGNVAIGTNDADIEGIGSNYKQLTISSPTTLYPGMITFQTPSSASGSAEIARVHYLNGTTRAAQFLVKPDGATNSAFMAWATANAGTLAERLRITGAGHVLINTTSLQGVGGLSLQVGGNHVAIENNTTSSAGNGTEYQVFRRNSSQIGSITMNGTTAVQYNTSSDYRLKENVVTEWDATTRLKQLKPSRFNFITEPDRTVDGFLAHEVQDIVPEAIAGEKDAVDAEGNPKYQGIDQSKLVPLLTKALQEQQTIIDDLKSRIETLEG